MRKLPNGWSRFRLLRVDGSVVASNERAVGAGPLRSSPQPRWLGFGPRLMWTTLDGSARGAAVIHAEPLFASCPDNIAQIDHIGRTMAKADERIGRSSRTVDRQI